MTPSEMDRRFDYHPPKDGGIRHSEIRARVRNLADELDDMLPEGYEKSVAITKLEEALFWSNAAVARNQ